MFTGMVWEKKLFRNFFDAIDGTNFHAKSTESTTPLVDEIVIAPRDDCVLRADKPASIARDANGSDFQAQLVHNLIIRQITSGTIKSQKERRHHYQRHGLPWSGISLSVSSICLPPPTFSFLTGLPEKKCRTFLVHCSSPHDFEFPYLETSPSGSVWIQSFRSSGRIQSRGRPLH